MSLHTVCFVLWLEPILSKISGFEDSHEGDQWHLLLCSSKDYVSSSLVFFIKFSVWIIFLHDLLTPESHCAFPHWAGAVSAIIEFLHVKTQFLPKTSSTKPNRQVVFPLQSTFLAQGQVTLAASLCIFSTSSSSPFSSLLEPDLLLTTNEYRKKETPWRSGYKHDLSTPWGLNSTPPLCLQGRFNTSAATRKPDLPVGMEENHRPPPKMQGGTPSSHLIGWLQWWEVRI